MAPGFDRNGLALRRQFPGSPALWQLYPHLSTGKARSGLIDNETRESEYRPSDARGQRRPARRFADFLFDLRNHLFQLASVLDEVVAHRILVSRFRLGVMEDHHHVRFDAYP